MLFPVNGARNFLAKAPFTYNLFNGSPWTSRDNLDSSCCHFVCHAFHTFAAVFFFVVVFVLLLCVSCRLGSARDVLLPPPKREECQSKRKKKKSHNEGHMTGS